MILIYLLAFIIRYRFQVFHHPSWSILKDHNSEAVLAVLTVTGNIRRLQQARWCCLMGLAELAGSDEGRQFNRYSN